MDIYPMLFDLQLIVIIATLLVFAFDDKIKRWEKSVMRRIRHKGGIRMTDGKVICRDRVHRMSGEEIVRIVNDVYDS